MLPPFLEQKDAQREPHGFRIQSDLLRYHQSSTVSGRIWIDGETIEVRDEEWFGFRDHSWGIRMDVGEPAPDVFKPQRLERELPPHVEPDVVPASGRQHATRSTTTCSGWTGR